MAGASRVHWLTQETHTDARALYDRGAERPGFIQYGKIFRPLGAQEFMPHGDAAC
jgi:hypothetical protein